MFSDVALLFISLFYHGFGLVLLHAKLDKSHDHRVFVAFVFQQQRFLKRHIQRHYIGRFALCVIRSKTCAWGRVNACTKGAFFRYPGRSAVVSINTTVHNHGPSIIINNGTILEPPPEVLGSFFSGIDRLVGTAGGGALSAVYVDGVTQAEPGQSGSADTLLHGRGDIEAGLSKDWSSAFDDSVNLSLRPSLAAIHASWCLAAELARRRVIPLSSVNVLDGVAIRVVRVRHHLKIAASIAHLYRSHLPTTNLRQELLYCRRDDGVVEGLHAFAADLEVDAGQRLHLGFFVIKVLTSVNIFFWLKPIHRIKLSYIFSFAANHFCGEFLANSVS